MRIDTIIVIAAAIFLAYAYFHNATAVEQMWEKFLRAIESSSIFS